MFDRKQQLNWYIHPLIKPRKVGWLVGLGPEGFAWNKDFKKEGGGAGSRGGCLKKWERLEPPYKLWGIWTTLYEILAIKISKNMLTQQTFNKIIWFRTLIFPKTVSHSIINNYHFLKAQKETFQMHICQLL